MDRPIIILGGGLWGGLLAYRLQMLRPQQNFILVEKTESLGGEHTWSFHESDISKEDFSWLTPFIIKSWSSYEVRFPKNKRSLELAYHSISSKKFHDYLVSTIPKHKLKFNTEMSLETALQEGSLVFDARGVVSNENCGYQKFIGLDLKLKMNHALKHPILMDACIPQIDGFRFMYVLPWSENTLLVEDTRYSNSETMDASELEKEILNYAKNSGWEVESIIRRESGVLPIPLKNSAPAQNSKIVDLSYIFHDTTGYSLPFAVKAASEISKLKILDLENAQLIIQNLRSEIEDSRKFFRMLNRLLFKSAVPNERYRMLEFFYKHSPDLIKNFYAGKLTSFDKFRFFLGRPPVSITRAAKTLILDGVN